MKLKAAIILGVILSSCQGLKQDALTENKIRLITLDPGHFHAALVQKHRYADVDSTVHVYAPAGDDLDLHLKRIDAFNTRKEDPTNWNEHVYKGNDFLEKMLEEKSGNVVVISGNNNKKTDYILKCLSAGLNVLADKPMAITPEDLSSLKKSFAIAEASGILLYDIMTERFEITSILQRELALMPRVFGTLQQGTPEDPAVVKESVHHFYKNVSGNVLVRPAWFFDAEQQGDGIVDVTTHLVDLIQWTCFPEQIIDTSTVKINDARRWPTSVTLSQFSRVTGFPAFPDYFAENVRDSALAVYSNGQIDYEVKGIHARVAVTWAFEAPAGAGDTHFSIMRGSNASLVIRQGPEQDFKPVLYVEPVVRSEENDDMVADDFAILKEKYPGLERRPAERGWEVFIPDSYREGHEAHFARVMERFLEYLKNHNMPDWEVPNMIAKYYTTTRALEMAKQNNP